jgi:hypothetical protein
MWELCISLVCMDGSCVNFHNFSIDPVKVNLVSVVLILV